MQKLLGEWFVEAALLPNKKGLPCVRYVCFKLWVSTNQIRYRKNVCLFFVQVRLGTSKVGVQIGYISSRTNNLMKVFFSLCLSDNCCFHKRLSPGRSKTYVTFHITEESGTYVIIDIFSHLSRVNV